MPYSLPDDIEKIRHYSKGASSYFGVLPQLVTPLLGGNPTLQTDVAAALNQLTPSFQLLLRKTVPIMLCIAWETFVEELKIADNVRYFAHFPAGFELYHNEDIREVFLIRNCIVHRSGKTDADYLKKSLIKTFTAARTAIDFTDLQLDTQFKLFGDAYAKIVV